MTLNANLSEIRVAQQVDALTAVSGTNAEAMLVKSIEVAGSPESLNREDIRGDSFDATSMLSGKWGATATIEQNLRSNGTAGTAPETDYLWDSLFGSSHASTASTISSGTNTTTFECADPSNFEENDIILVGVGAGATTEATRIKTISSSTFTVGPALSTTPSVSDAITAGVTYKPATSGQNYLTIDHYVNSILLRRLTGGKVGSMSLTVENGTIPTVSWSLEGIIVTETITTQSGTASYDTQAPPVALSCGLKYNGTEIPFTTFSLEINNNIERHDTADSTYGTAAIMQGKRAVTGSITLETPTAATTYFDAMKNKTAVELQLEMGIKTDSKWTAGKTIVINLPEVQFSERTFEAASVAKDTLGFTAYSTSAEESVFIGFI